MLRDPTSYKEPRGRPEFSQAFDYDDLAELVTAPRVSEAANESQCPLSLPRRSETMTTPIQFGLISLDFLRPKIESLTILSEALCHCGQSLRRHDKCRACGILVGPGHYATHLDAGDHCPGCRKN